MKNIKEEVYRALLTVTKAVSDVYPSTWAEGSTIQYTEEDNSVFEAISNEYGNVTEEKAKVRYRIDIWDRMSTSTTALAVDAAIAKLVGLKRVACMDVPDPSGYKHKQMRYEGIIDMNTDHVFWN